MKDLKPHVCPFCNARGPHAIMALCCDPAKDDRKIRMQKETRRNEIIKAIEIADPTNTTVAVNFFEQVIRNV